MIDQNWKDLFRSARQSCFAPQLHYVEIEGTNVEGEVSCSAKLRCASHTWIGHLHPVRGPQFGILTWLKNQCLSWPQQWGSSWQKSCRCHSLVSPRWRSLLCLALLSNLIHSQREFSKTSENPFCWRCLPTLSETRSAPRWSSLSSAEHKEECGTN